MEKTFIGIDVSKSTLDLYVKSSSLQEHFKIENSVMAIKKFLKPFKNDKNTIIAMENTGRYNFALYEFLAVNNFSVFVINPLHLNRSMGLLRGKNDKVDAQRICLFIEKNYMDLESWVPTTNTIQKLSLFNTERRHRVKLKSGLLRQLQDIKLLNNIVDKDLIKLNNKLVREIEKQIEFIENKILKLILSNEELKEQYNRMMTIPGVGKVLATLMIVKTKGFSEVNSARKMACFAGVVPFEHRSGTSIYQKPRVSTMADKELKKVLHLAALSTIRLKNEMAEYFHRKVEEGKNKMSVINAIRNKIIHRIYAVIKNKTVYQNSLVLS